MALSYYANWGSFQQLDSDISIADPLPQAELPPELRAFPDAWNVDYFFEPNDLFYSESSNYLLYDIPNGVPYETEPFLLQQEFEPFQYTKRQKGCDFEETYSDQFKPAFFNGLVPNPCPMLQDYSPQEIVVPPLPDFPTGPPGYTSGNCESPKKEPTAASLSAQSIAARQRRRKITEKTQELGKLVPGGHKMNTAEMLQAANKYIKYLQAQVGVLEFIGSYHQVNLLIIFLNSYSEERMLVRSNLLLT